MVTLVSRYKKLIIQHMEAQTEEARAKARYDATVADRKGIEREMAEVEAALEFGEKLMATAPSAPVPSSDVAGDGPPKSIRDLVLLIPREGEASRADLVEGLGIKVGALNTRLVEAKRRRYIEASGTKGHFKLTDKGKAVHGVRLGLKVVPGGN